MLSRLRRRWFPSVIVGGIILALVGFATRPADATTTTDAVNLAVASSTPPVPIRRIGLNCQDSEYLIWGVRYCVTIRARKDSRGRWWFQPAAAIAGWNAQGRRTMRLVAAVRSGGATSAAAAKAKRLVVRGPWRLGTGQADDTRAVFVLKWPNGKKSAFKLWSRA